MLIVPTWTGMHLCTREGSSSVRTSGADPKGRSHDRPARLQMSQNLINSAREMLETLLDLYE